MANSAYASGINLDALMVNTKAATVYTAQENSLYLSGGIIPMIQVNPGSMVAQVPVMGSVSATILSAEAAPGVDLDAVLPTDTFDPITLDLHAARTVLRDLGGVDPQDMGRILGNAVAASVDKTITGKFATLTAQELAGVPGTNTLSLEDLYTAVATIRGNGETGELFGIISTDAYASLMGAIGGAAFAGGEFQNSAMRNGFFGRIAGVQCFVSSYVNNTNIAGTLNPKMAILSADAMRGAIQSGVNLEVERRAAAVGWDVVASAAFGAGVIDASRGVLIQDAS